VPITNDTLPEASETFTVTLSGASNATIADATGIGTISDNDQLPVIDLDANNSTAAGSGYSATYTENGTPVSVADTDISITDVDSATLTGATITLSNAQAGDVLAVGSLPSGITASVVGNTVTLSGSASLANYQSAIRAITFSSSSENPSTTPRSITVVVNDGQNNSLPATATINVVAVNDAPVGVADAFTLQEGATAILGNVLSNDTDVDSLSLSVGQFATNASGTGAAAANGTNSITTALGGTVVMNANGTFTYTAPVRNHSDATPDVDSFAYRASDGSATSGWTTVSINLTDTSPIANDDVNSLAGNNSTSGNVITDTGGADILGADSASISNVAVTQGTEISNNLVGDVRTIVTSNGTLVINQADGSYTYTRAADIGVAAGANYNNVNTAKTAWGNAGFTLYGYDNESGFANPYLSGNPASGIDPSRLDGTQAGYVRHRNNSGTNNDGFGVENANGSNNDNRIENNEHLLIQTATVAEQSLPLSILPGHLPTWYLAQLRMAHISVLMG
jgi:hypothetical protein